MRVTVGGLSPSPRSEALLGSCWAISPGSALWRAAAACFRKGRFRPPTPPGRRCCTRAHEAMPQRAARVLGEEQGVGVVVEPREPEQVPLVGCSGRVVGEGVEQEVQIVEPLGERRRRLASGCDAWLMCLSGGCRRGRRADLGLERDRGLPEERPDLPQGRRKRLRGRNQLARRGPENLRKLVGAGESALRLLKRRRELLERRPDRVLFLRERAQNGVRRAHEPRQLRVAMPELRR